MPSSSKCPSCSLCHASCFHTSIPRVWDVLSQTHCDSCHPADPSRVRSKVTASLRNSSLKYHPLFCPQTEEIILQDLVLISLIILYLPLQSDCGDLRTGLSLVYFLLQGLALYLAHLSRILNAHSVITWHIREPSRWWACNRNSKAYRLALASCIVLQWVLI